MGKQIKKHSKMHESEREDCLFKQVQMRFIHFSSSTQLALTLDLYFKSDDKVILLQIDEEKLNSPLVYEEADGNRIGKFPHLYDKLSVQSISKKWELHRNAFELPIEVLKYIEDRK